jgi:hypothetical protein
MRIQSSHNGVNVSYSFNSVVCLFTFASIQYLSPRISLTTGVVVLFIGVISILYNWAVLATRLGICPGVYHSTLCTPTMKKEEINFKSSKVLEYGTIYGTLGAIYFYCWVNTHNSVFLLSINVLSYLCILIGKDIYQVSDLIGMILVMIANGMVVKYNFYYDYWYQIGIFFTFSRVLMLTLVKHKAREAGSIAIVSIVVEGLGLCGLGYYFNGLGDINDGLVGFLYALGSFVMVEANVSEKPGVFLAIFTLQIYTFTNNLSLIPCIISILGILLLIIGQRVFQALPIRINSALTASNMLNTSLL